MATEKVTAPATCGIHICAPPVVDVHKRRRRCSTCHERTTFLVESFEWYPTTWTCLKCGDQWSGDGERRERPFCPGWRPRSVDSARLRWDRWKSRAK